MASARRSDEEVVARARRAVGSKGQLRKGMLIYALSFLGFAGYITIRALHRIEALDGEQLKLGFVYGLMLAVLWTSFGLVGALCLAKFLMGFDRDVRQEELLVRYHDRLRDLGHLP